MTEESSLQRKKTSNRLKKNEQLLQREENLDFAENNSVNEVEVDQEIPESTEQESAKSASHIPRRKRRSKHVTGVGKLHTKREVPETFITAVLEELNDDMTDEPVRYDTGDYSVAEPVAQTSVSIPPDKVYVERKNGFATTPRVKMFQPLGYVNNGIADAGYTKSVGTPLELAILIQKYCHPLYTLCHGLLGGMALLHIILVYGAGDFFSQNSTFISMYSNYARVYQTLFQLLSILCFISIMDRCDVKHMDANHLIDLCRHHLTTILVFVTYFVTLVIGFVTMKWDDWLALSSHSKESNTDNLEVWKNLNLCRNIWAIGGWILITFCSNDDMLYIHLCNMVKYQSVNTRVIPARY